MKQMKNRKKANVTRRGISILLALILMASAFAPGAAYATGETEAPEPCIVCNVADCGLDHVWCEAHGAWDCQSEEHDLMPLSMEPCGSCGNNPCICPPVCGTCEGAHKTEECTKCAVCKNEKTECTCPPVCGTCEGEHKTEECTICDVCGLDKKENLCICAPVCGICTLAHKTEECTKCPVCLNEKADCTCPPVCEICEGEHKTEECTICDVCGLDKKENLCICAPTCGICMGPHKDADCPLCPDCGKETCECTPVCEVCQGEHKTEECTKCPTCLYEVADCVCALEGKYLRNGAKIYKNYADAAEEPKVIGKWNKGIKVKNTFTAEDGTAWYEFTYTNLLAELFNGYHYVRVSDTSAAKCTCAVAPAADGTHEAGCPLVPMMATAPKSAYEKALEDLAALEEEAKTLADGLDVEAEDYIEKLTENCNTFFNKLFEKLIEIEDKMFAGEITEAEYFDAVNKYDEIVAYLRTAYRYEDGTITPMAALTDVWGSSSENIKVHLFNYGTRINAIANADGETIQYNTSGNNNVTEGTWKSTYGKNDERILVFQSGGSANFRETDANTLARLSQSNPLLGRLDDEGYPVIKDWYAYNENEGKVEVTTDADNNRAGSLKYLFDTDMGFVSGGGTETSYEHGITDYQSMHFPITDLNLFQYNAQTQTYVYDSLYNAAYLTENSTGYTLNSYDFALRGFRHGDTANGQGHFMPFNTVKDGKVVQITDSEGNVIKKDGLTENTDFFQLTDTNATKQGIIVPNLYALKTEPTDMFMGMSIEFEFLMPEDGMVAQLDAKGNPTGETEEMIFEFTGDDDVVVYIDGYPVLNLGGPRPRTRGSINFATGQVTVYDNETGGPQKTPIANAVYRTTTLKELFAVGGRYDTEYSDYDPADVNYDAESGTYKDYTTHTLQFYYLERYGGSSNCKLEFNMLPVPENSLTVAKDVRGGGTEISGEQFTFTVELKDQKGNPVTEGVSYMHNNGTAVAKTSSNGKYTFQLKDNEMGTIIAPIKTSYTVSEASYFDYTTTWQGETSGTLDGNAVSVTCVNELNVGRSGVDKTVAEGDVLGEYIIDLSAWATAEQITTTEKLPVDVVFVLDQSASMYKPAAAVDDMKCQTPFGGTIGGESTQEQKTNTGEMSRSEFVKLLQNGNGTYTAAEMQKKAAQPGYFIARASAPATNENSKYNGMWYLLKYVDGKLYIRRSCKTNNTIAESTACPNTVAGHEPHAADAWISIGSLDNFGTSQELAHLSRIYVTQYGKMYDAVTDFIDESKASGADHRFAFVGFAGSSKTNTALFIDGTAYHHSKSNIPYSSALTNVQTNYANMISSVDKMVAEYGGTGPAYVMPMVQKIFQNSSLPEGETEPRSRVVIFVTDGQPTEPTNKTEAANSAIANAKPLKQSPRDDTNGKYDAKVYTICTSSGTIGEAESNFLSYISSEYPNATSLTDSGTKAEGTYSYMEENANTLVGLFKQIQENEMLNVFKMDATTILRDVISDEFIIPNGKLGEIKVYQVPYTGNGTFAESGWTDKTESVTIRVYESATATEPIGTGSTADGKKIEITGFDYSAIPVIDYSDNNFSGAKLLVRVPIALADSNPGGNHQATNDKDDSGIYDEDGKKVDEFDLPHVDTPVYVTVKKNVTGNMGDIQKLFSFSASGTKFSQRTIIPTAGVEEHSYYLADETDTAPGSSNWLKAHTDPYSDSFTLKHNGSKDLPPLYYGSELQITEIPEGYVLTVTCNGEEIEDEYLIKENGKTVGVKLNASGDMEFIFTNNNNALIDTGVVLDSLPYILILGGVAAVAVFLILRRRNRYDD